MQQRGLKKVFQNVRAKRKTKLFSRSDADRVSDFLVRNRKIQAEHEKRLAKP